MSPEEQKIYQEFSDYFRKAMSEDDRLDRFAEKLTKGEATYVDAWDYARRVGGQVSDALLEVAEDILLSEDGYDIVMSALHDGYQEAAEYAAEVQTLLNQEAGLGIKGVKPDFMTGRASGIAHQASNAEDLETTEYYLGSPAQHFTENVVGDTIKANEEFQYRSGLNPKIKRTAIGGCCEWCQAVAGEYDYPADDLIYRRHANCDCLVEYYPGNGLKQNAHTKRWAAISGLKQTISKTINHEIINDDRQGSPTSLLQSISDHPKILGAYTPEGLKAALERGGIEVKPLGRGALKDIPFEQGGGYRVHFGKDGLLQYHPEKGSHHHGEYYKISTGKGGKNHYDRFGNPIIEQLERPNREQNFFSL